MTKPTRRPTKEELEAAYDKTLPDVIAPKLEILFVGINPSLYTAAIGHHFGRPGNRFWPALHKSGLTPRLYDASEDGLLIELGIGVTNMVARATARADELDNDEICQGVKSLERRMRGRDIGKVVFLGVTTYRVGFGEKKAKIGPQHTTFGGADVWVLPNTSGLNAHYQIADFAKLFAQLKD